MGYNERGEGPVINYGGGGEGGGGAKKREGGGGGKFYLYVKKSGVDPVGVRTAPPLPLFGDPTTSKRWKNVACMHTNAARFSTLQLPRPPPPPTISEILYLPLRRVGL